MASAILKRKAVPRNPSLNTQLETDVTKDINSLSLDSSSAGPEPAPHQFLGSPDSVVASPESTFTLASGDEILELPSPDTPASAGDKQSAFKTAFQDVRHFAGGLISHPYEASSHYSVLRHSHGLVYFKGFNTNVAITVFGDRELPPDRQYWLQKRGFSGKTGLKIGASMFGTKTAWINVTPATTASADHLPQTDERAWQRDIEKFLRKAPKSVRKHVARETCILRIPCSADDGYFRVVLCSGEKGKKTLCPSPIFRLVSTSTSMGSVRGASLSTMPLEIGMKIGQFVARQAASNAVAPLAGTVTSQVQGMIPWQPSVVAQTAASTAYGAASSGIAEQSEQARQRNVEQFMSQLEDELDHSSAIGSDSGPEPPFPLQFSAKVIKGTGRSRQELGMPTANLTGVPDDVMLRLTGAYCGWATIAPQKGVDLPPVFLDDWYQAVIAIVPRPDSKAAAVMKKDVHVYLIQDFQELEFFNAKLKIMVMGLIRSRGHINLAEIKDPKERMLIAYRDIAVTQASLIRPAWEADNVLTRIKSDKSNRSISEKFSSAQQSVSKQTDKVPLHLAGVRSESMTLRDRLVGNGGVAVRR